MKFPMFVELDQKRAVVVGAGTVGTRRIGALEEFGAVVTVVAPEISDEVRLLFEDGRIFWECRTVEKQDVEQAFLVVAAADDRNVNHQVFLWCREAGIPVNVADRKEECDFYFPGLAKSGLLTAGVCAGGEDHKLAGQAAEAVRNLFAEKFDG